MQLYKKGYIEVFTSHLIKAPWNYKTDDVSKAQKLTEGIRRNGQIVNLIVRYLGLDTFEVVNGNHRLDSLIELGMVEAMCYNLGEISLEEAQRIAIETNELNFEADHMKLSALLAKLTETYNVADLETTMPYSDAEFEAARSIENFNWKGVEANNQAKVQKREAQETIFTITIAVQENVFKNWQELLKKLGGTEAEAFDVAVGFAREAHGF